MEQLRPRLNILACAVTGRPIEIFPAEQEGGYKNNNFFLPFSCQAFPSFEQNRAYFIFRVLYLSVQKKLDLNWHISGEKETIQSRQKALESSEQVLPALFAEYPITEAWHQDFFACITESTPQKAVPDYSLLYGKWMVNALETDAVDKLQYFNDKVKLGSQQAPETILKAKIVEEIINLQVDKKSQEDYVMTHNFEKVETAEEFSGVWRDFDGDDELESHQDALDEVSMKYTVRVDDPAHSVYQADFQENTTISESAEMEFDGVPITYHEWDYSKRAYKFDFCKLHPFVQLKTDAAYYKTTLVNHTSTLMGLRKMMTSINNKLQQQRRQNQGESFDIDCVTDLFVDIHSGHTPSENIYLSKRKKDKDLSVLLLLDVSLSSDGYADGNRIIDVEKQVSILFGEILHEFNIDFSVNCFHSKTRNYAVYTSLKSFEEPWSKAKYKIGAIVPGGYTRIGAALRHSGALLNSRNTKNKWVILISDGKPNDFDKYEGRYGIQDVKQALRELNADQISAYALAIEVSVKLYLS